MPSVTIIDGMRPRVTSIPLTAPASGGRIRPPVLVATAPAATAQRPIIEPVEMSISAHRITWLTARAMVPSTATETTMDSRLEPLRNLSLLTEKATTRTARNTRAGASGRTIHRRKPVPMAPPSAVVGARASLIFGCLLSRTIRGRPVFTAGGRGHHHLLIDLASPELAGDLALPHDHDSIRHREDLLQLRRDEQYGLPLLGELVYEAVDLRFGSNVDAPGRFVEEQDGRLAGQRFR